MKILMTALDTLTYCVLGIYACFATSLWRNSLLKEARRENWSAWKYRIIYLPAPLVMIGSLIGIFVTDVIKPERWVYGSLALCATLTGLFIYKSFIYKSRFEQWLNPKLGIENNNSTV